MRCLWTGPYPVPPDLCLSAIMGLQARAQPRAGAHPHAGQERAAAAGGRGRCGHGSSLLWKRIWAAVQPDLRRLCTQLHGQHRRCKTCVVISLEMLTWRTNGAHRPQARHGGALYWSRVPHSERSRARLKALGLLDCRSSAYVVAHAVLGVNLIYAALMHAGNPTAIISSLLDDLTRARIEARPLHLACCLRVWCRLAMARSVCVGLQLSEAHVSACRDAAVADECAPWSGTVRRQPALHL